MRLRRFPTALVLGLVVTSGVPRVLASAPDLDQVTVQAASKRLALTLGSPHAWAVLQLAGANEWVHTATFDGDEPIAFEVEGGTKPPPDGRLDWQVIWRPREAVDPTDQRRQSGRVMVTGGVFHALPEPESGGADPSGRRPLDTGPTPPAGLSPMPAASQHIDGDLTLTGGVCAGCASGSSPGLGGPQVDAHFALAQKVAFGDDSPPTLQMVWETGFGNRLVFFTPDVVDDFEHSFGEYKVGFGTANLGRELNLAGEPLPDAVFPGTTRRSPEIMFQALTDSAFFGLSTRDWELGASTAAFYIRDITADTTALEILAGATGKIVVADNSIGIEGDLFLPEDQMTARTIQLASSREGKESLVEVDGETVLRRLAEVPVYEWSFRDAGDGARHIGPMSEDFHAAFELEGKSVEHLSVTDLAGVSLAAIKALEARVASLEAENRRLAERIRGQGDAACQ